jgi:signal transduction histidine kinase
MIQPAVPDSAARAAQAVATRRQLDAAFARRKSLSHLRLGDALIQARLISVQQRDAALAAQAIDRGRLLGEILVEAGAVSPAAIRRVLVEQMGVPSVDLAKIGSEAAAIAAVDAALARKYTALPLYRTETRIAVAMENPFWWDALREIEAATGLKVDAGMAPLADLTAAIDRHYEGATERVRVLSARVLSIQEEERARISRELHDDVGQSLTALTFALHRLGPLVGSEGRTLHADCLAMADITLERVRQLASDLRPPQLDTLGLEEALRWLVERQCAATGLDIKCHFNGLLGRRVPGAIEGACYRIAQEALSNATRHASAHSILVAVEATKRALILTVRDDGRGLDKAAQQRASPSSGLGLIGMSERAGLAGGHVTINGEPGQGTIVRAIFGLERPPEPA